MVCAQREHRRREQKQPKTSRSPFVPLDQPAESFVADDLIVSFSGDGSVHDTRRWSRPNHNESWLLTLCHRNSEEGSFWELIFRERTFAPVWFTRNTVARATAFLRISLRRQRLWGARPHQGKHSGSIRLDWGPFRKVGFWIGPRSKLSNSLVWVGRMVNGLPAKKSQWRRVRRGLLMVPDGENF